MQYILDSNRAAQEKLKGSNPKELYIPFNAGRRTGIKPKANQDNVFSTAPSAGSIKLTEWVESRLADQSIALPDTRVYKIYSANWTQTGTNNPVFTVHENTIGNITWARTNTGVFTATLNGAFPFNRTQVYSIGIVGSNNAPRIAPAIVNPNTNSLTISAYSNAGVAADDSTGYLEIRVYN